MTLTEFLSKLFADHRVSFSDAGPHLDMTRVEGLSQMLADALPRALPDTAEIHSGWQEGELRGNFSGAAWWWLISGDQLVRVVPSLKPNLGDRRIVDIALMVVSLAEARAAVTFTYSHDVFRGGEPKLYGARISVHAEGEQEPIEISGEGEFALAAAHFVRHLANAVESSRARRAEVRGGAHGQTR